MMIRTSVSESIIYSKEKDNWIINWPTYRYRFPDKFSLRNFFSFCDSQYGRISFLLRDMTFTWRPRAAVLLVSKCVVFQGYLSGMFFLLAQQLSCKVLTQPHLCSYIAFHQNRSEFPIEHTLSTSSSPLIFICSVASLTYSPMQL